MATKLTTEQLALHFCNIINKDIEKKPLNANWYIDFGITKNEIPNDFNQNVFLNIIKDTFNLTDIQIEDFDYKLRVIGRFMVKKWSFSGEIPMTQEEFNRLKGFASGK